MSRPTIICKKCWKNYARSEKTVTTSEALTEYTIGNCTRIDSNSELRLRIVENSGKKKWEAQTRALYLVPNPGHAADTPVQATWQRGRRGWRTSASNAAYAPTRVTHQSE